MNRPKDQIISIILLALQRGIARVFEEISGESAPSIDAEMIEPEGIEFADIVIWVDGRAKAHFAYRMNMGVAG